MITDAQFAELKAEVEALRKEMGTLIAGAPGDLGDGAADVHTRLDQLNTAFTTGFARIAPIAGGQTIDNYIKPLADRVTKLEAQPAPSQTPVPQPNVVNGNLTVSGKLAVGGPVIDAQQTIHVHGTGSAGMLCIANEQGLDQQNPNYKHVTSFTCDNDGGGRMIQGTYNRQSDGVEVWPTPNRPRTIVALDSFGTLSLSQDLYADVFGKPTAPRPQKLVFYIDHNAKKIMLSVEDPNFGLAYRKVNALHNDYTNYTVLI